MRNWTLAELQEKFRMLTEINHVVTSRATARYNCLAFANGDERRCWDPQVYGGMFYWPVGLPREWSLEVLVRLFEAQGYSASASRDHEVGKEKIAIYVDLISMSPSHIALSNGSVWRSKLGQLQDIEHQDLDILEGQDPAYGIVDRVLERPLQTTRQ